MSDSITDPDFGIILNLKYFIGIFEIGGSDYFDPTKAEGKVNFSNIVGHYNDYTASHYPDWNVSSIINNETIMLYVYSGAGSILFNTASSTNAFTFIQFSDVNFTTVYGNQLIDGGSDPLILSTQIQNNRFFSSWTAVF